MQQPSPVKSPVLLQENHSFKALIKLPRSSEGEGMHSPARSCPALVLCHSAEAFQSSLGNEDMNDGEDLTRARVLPVLPQALGQGKEGAWLSCRLKQVLLSQHLRPQVFRGKLPVVQHQFDKKM